MGKCITTIALVLIAAAVINVLLILMIFFAVPVKAELCLAKIDPGIEKKSGYRWLSLTVDGRKCWFYSNTLLPKEDLIWSYDSKDFDSDVTVIERKFYFPERRNGE